MKGSFDVDHMTPDELQTYADLCGWALAGAHARSGDASAISGYLGSKDRFDRAIGEFGVRYTEQNQRDFEALTEAVSGGRIEAPAGI